MLSDEKHHGLWLHTTLALTPQRVPLGIIDQRAWTRSPDELGKSVGRRQRPIEEKESHRWLDSLEATSRMQAQLPNTQVINVGDREADIYDLFQKAVTEKTSLLIRAAWNRRVDHPQAYLWPYLESQPVAATVTITVPSKAQKPTRQANLTLRYAPVTLLPPEHRRHDGLCPLEVWAVLAREENPPADVEAVSWLLLTTVEVTTCEAALERLQWYTCRWEVEVYHKVLKSGCRIEERQFNDIAAIKRYLALDSIVGWRVLFLTMLGRQLPDMPCTAILEAHEWQALYCFTHKTDTPPSQPPTLREATHWIGQLGGFLGRAGDRDPGVTTVWRGLQRLADPAAAFVLFHPQLSPTPAKRSVSTPYPPILAGDVGND